MPHTHVIDNKVLTFDNATCPYCHPEQQRPPKQEQQEILPRVYRTAKTVVLKISKITLITLTPYEKEKCYLLTTQRMLRDQQGKALRDKNNNPLWTKITVRANAQKLKDFITQASILLRETENTQTAPIRN